MHLVSASASRLVPDLVISQTTADGSHELHLLLRAVGKLEVNAERAFGGRGWIAEPIANPRTNQDGLARVHINRVFVAAFLVARGTALGCRRRLGP